jgi:hypothetical protein
MKGKDLRERKQRGKDWRELLKGLVKSKIRTKH